MEARLPTRKLTAVPRVPPAGGVAPGIVPERTWEAEACPRAPLYFCEPHRSPDADPDRAAAGQEKESRINKKEEAVRVNERIRIPNIRVVDDEGNQLGIMSSRDALNLARERGLDLVEVSPLASPPVCRIMDYGKFKYEASKRANKDKKKQHRVQVKEIKFKVKIDDHDFDFKVANAKKFLIGNNRVKFTVSFRGREISHPELGRELLNRAAKEVEEVGLIESHPRLDGFAMTMYVVPRKDRVHTKQDKEDGASG